MVDQRPAAPATSVRTALPTPADRRAAPDAPVPAPPTAAAPARSPSRPGDGRAGGAVARPAGPGPDTGANATTMPQRSRAERRREGLLPPGEDPMQGRGPTGTARPGPATPPGAGRRRTDRSDAPGPPAPRSGAGTAARPALLSPARRPGPTPGGSTGVAPLAGPSPRPLDAWGPPTSHAPGRSPSPAPVGRGGAQSASLAPLAPSAGPPTELTPVPGPPSAPSGPIAWTPAAPTTSAPPFLAPVAGPPSAPATAAAPGRGPVGAPRTGERPTPGPRTGQRAALSPAARAPVTGDVPTGAASRALADAAQRASREVPGHDAPPPVPGPVSGPVGGRAAARLERQAAEAAARKAGRRGSTAMGTGTAPPGRRPAADVGAPQPSSAGMPSRPVQFLLAMVIVAMVLLGVWTFGAPATQEASSEALPDGAGAAVTSIEPPAAPPAVAAPSAEVLPPVAAVPPGPVRAPVTVLNSTAISGLAASIAEQIGAGGWELRETGPYGATDVAITTVYYTPGDAVQEAAAGQLVEQFPDVSGPAPRFFEVPEVTDPGLVVVATGNWQP